MYLFRLLYSIHIITMILCIVHNGHISATAIREEKNISLTNININDKQSAIKKIAKSIIQTLHKHNIIIPLLVSYGINKKFDGNCLTFIVSFLISSSFIHYLTENFDITKKEEKLIL